MRNFGAKTKSCLWQRTLLSQAVSSEVRSKRQAHSRHESACFLMERQRVRTSRTASTTKNGKLKVLFVGALSQRKGLSYLMEAAGHLGSKIELTLIGRRISECRPLDAALRTHRWIPSISHGALLEEMSRHDVMVFPSLFEGFGLVILEAMSQGVPVIATPNTAAPDFVSDGDDGFIVPIRDADAIASKLELLTLDRDLLAAMSQAAIRTAADTFLGAISSRHCDHRRFSPGERSRGAITLAATTASGGVLSMLNAQVRTQPSFGWVRDETGNGAEHQVILFGE